ADFVALLSQILSFDPPLPSEVEPRIPVAISNAITRAMAKRPEARFGSMADLVRALNGEAVEGAPPEPSLPAPISAESFASIAAPPGVRGRTAVGRWATVAVAIVASASALLTWRTHVERER